MLRLSPAQVGVLRSDDGVVHRPAQVRRHIAPGKPGDRTIPPGGQLTPHFQLRDVLPGQKAGRRAAVRLQHRPQQVAGVCLFAAQPSGQLHRLIQQLPRLPGEALISSFAECVPNAHLPGSYLPYCPVAYPVASRNSIAPAGEKKSELCVAPAQKRTER